LKVAPLGLSQKKMVLQKVTDLVANSGLSKSGADFVTQTLDPFHDVVIPPTGFPGGGTANTIIQRIRQTIDVVQPPSITGNWDCNISLLPLVTQEVANGIGSGPSFVTDNGGGHSTNILAANPNGASWGNASVYLSLEGLAIACAPEGVATWTSSSAVVTGLSISDYITGPCRVVSAGSKL